MNQLLVIISALLFLFYGFACVYFESLKSEFTRYGLSKYRKLIGALEILGGIGQILGFLLYEPLLLLSSFCLALLMCCGVFVRLKVKDPLYQVLPALLLLIINVLIVVN